MVGMSDGLLKPLRQPAAPLRRKIVAALRGAIESGVLPPGARLIERDLCERLAVSRTCLREALRALTAEGVVSPAPGRGLMVARLTRRDIRNAYDIRTQLEGVVAARFVAHADDAELSLLVSRGRKLTDAYRTGSVAAILAAKRDFRELLCTGARDVVAREIISQLVLKTAALCMRSLSRSERRREGIVEIEAIIDAIRGRDVERAEVAAAQHVSNAAASALAVSEALATRHVAVATMLAA